ncbi:MAG TPA: TetR/AcrR family transcriptional regulator, partial [Solirubrobacteraceae bacterium]|nr:TetR/AcrR family transcriptional regulator [Solirubrobacteraceae bacterium]
MAANNVERRPPGGSDRYRPLPTGTHGLDPDAVKRDQRARLQRAMIELITQKGYQAVRIVDLARLAHVSQPTFYDLYADKEELFTSAYDEVAAQAARTITQSYDPQLPYEQRVRMGLRAWTKLAAEQSEATSLLVLGAFGAGAKALERRRRIVERLERAIAIGRSDSQAERPSIDAGDLTVKAILGGIREITGARLRAGRARKMPALADELTAWASCYPQQLPEGLQAPAARRPPTPSAAAPSERARRAEGRLPSGRSDLPRQFIVNSQRERILDATAAIVAEDGLDGLTIPKIARRANVSHQTFYDNYASKR